MEVDQKTVIFNDFFQKSVRGIFEKVKGENIIINYVCQRVKLVKFEQNLLENTLLLCTLGPQRSSLPSCVWNGVTREPVMHRTEHCLGNTIPEKKHKPEGGIFVWQLSFGCRFLAFGSKNINWNK
nr:hypothetical protein W06A7.1 - Caenorhabditis elegans [Caenorhabditis elegans]